MSLPEILQIIVTGLSIISAIVSLIAYFTKNEKVAKAQQIIDKMKDLCVEAEKINPANKKDYVLFGIKHLCEELHVEYDQDYYSQIIDQFISYTKQINYKESK